MLKRGLIAGVVIFLVNLGLNWLFGMVSPQLSWEYQNGTLFRPWTDPLMQLYFVYPFVLAAALSYLWDRVKTKNAMEFTRLVFIVTTIPGMFVTFTSFQVSTLMVLTWMLAGLIESYTAAVVFSKVK